MTANVGVDRLYYFEEESRFIPFPIREKDHFYLYRSSCENYQLSSSFCHLNDTTNEMTFVFIFPHQHIIKARSPSLSLFIDLNSSFIILHNVINGPPFQPDFLHKVSLVLHSLDSIFSISLYSMALPRHHE